MGVTDGVLVVSHIYLIIDLVLDWNAFQACRKPIHWWLLVSYVLMLTSRMVYLAGTCFAAQDSNCEFLLNARQKSGKSKLLFGLTWGIIVPFTGAWNCLGTFWLIEVTRYNSNMLSNIQNHLWIMLIWQVLSYAWVGVHCRIGGMAWLLERRVRDAEDDLRQVADDDAISRWGQTVDHVQDYTMLRGSKQDAGMRPEEIHALPFEELREKVGLECAICLVATEVGDTVRRLEVCGHVFHKACIDLWLLRSSTCPLCKCCVKAQPSHCGAPQTTQADTAPRNSGIDGPRLRVRHALGAVV
jgi:hypothetical protein